MTRTRRRFSEYWDKLLMQRLPPYARLEKVEAELREHFDFVVYMFKRLVIPLVVLYVLLGILFKTNVLGSLFLSVLLFLYSNFLPDADILFKKTSDPDEASLWYERLMLLCFAPIVVYYVMAGRAKPLYALTDRPFHSVKIALVYALFLAVVGLVLWDEYLKTVMFALFGFAGFMFHLGVDGTLRFFRAPAHGISEGTEQGTA